MSATDPLLQTADSLLSLAVSDDEKTAIEEQPWADRLMQKLRDYERSEKRRLAMLMKKQDDDIDGAQMSGTFRSFDFRVKILIS